MLHKLYNPIESCRLKFADDKSGEFEGYASVFGGVDSYGDTIIPGAYAKSLDSGARPKGFVNHDSYQVPVIDWVELKEDEVGLFARGKVDLIHKDGPTVYSGLKRKALDGLSIGYTVPKGGGSENDTGGYDLTEIKLKEISVVNFPADDSARISTVKQGIEKIETIRDAEAFLRDLGCSKSAALAFVSCIKGLLQRDADSRAEDEIAKHELTSRLVEFINTKL